MSTNIYSPRLMYVCDPTACCCFCCDGGSDTLVTSKESMFICLVCGVRICVSCVIVKHMCEVFVTANTYSQNTKSSNKYTHSKQFTANCKIQLRTIVKCRLQLVGCWRKRDTTIWLGHNHSRNLTVRPRKSWVACVLKWNIISCTCCSVCRLGESVRNFKILLIFELDLT